MQALIQQQQALAANQAGVVSQAAYKNKSDKLEVSFCRGLDTLLPTAETLRISTVLSIPFANFSQ